MCHKSFLCVYISTQTIKLNLSGLGVEQSDEDAGGAWKSSTRVEGDLLKTVQRNESLKATLYETRRIIRNSENEVKQQFTGLPDSLSFVYS